jgi:hypothetical protein
MESARGWMRGFPNVFRDRYSRPNRYALFCQMMPVNGLECMLSDLPNETPLAVARDDIRWMECSERVAIIEDGLQLL